MPEIFNAAIDTPKGLVDFRFDRLPLTEEKMFATYCAYDEKDYCFHLMYEPESLEFKIIDARNCPQDLQDIAYRFSIAIEQHHA